MADLIQLRRDSSTGWTAINPVLAEGEYGLDLTLNQYKVGDGVTEWDNLPYYTGHGSVSITEFGYLNGVTSAIQTQLDTKQPTQNGFENRTDSTLSFVDATRTFSITGTFAYWSNGTRYTSTGASVVITDAEGLHYVYFNGATLATTTTFSEALITDYTFVSAIYWDATNDIHLLLMDERHGREMDSVTHLYLHNTQGARYGSGLGLTDIVTGGNGSLATHAQFGYESGSFWDEDIKHAISAATTPAQIPLFYRSGATGVWRRIAATDYPLTTTGTGRAAWNEWTGATWQLTEVTNNDWALTHLFATGDAAQPIIGVIGQDQYSLASAADDGATAELQALQFGILSTLTPEVLPIASILFKTSNTYTNAVKSRIEDVNGADYIDWRKTSAFSAGASGGVIDAINVINTPSGDILSTNVQSAINELDSEKLAASSYTAADVLTKLQTVDGASSGLDADLLDGNHASAFATSGHSHSGTYEPALGNPASDGQVLSSTAAGVRSWVDSPSGITDEFLALIYAGLN